VLRADEKLRTANLFAVTARSQGLLSTQHKNCSESGRNLMAVGTDSVAGFARISLRSGQSREVRIEQKRYEDAVDLLQQRYDAAQHAENLYDLAEALELAGHAGQAKNAFAEL
jgi:hypothetical protein